MERGKQGVKKSIEYSRGFCLHIMDFPSDELIFWDTLKTLYSNYMFNLHYTLGFNKESNSTYLYPSFLT